MLTVGNKLPQFCVPACVGSTADDLCEITNETYAGKWLVLLFYPKDFTFICPTELWPSVSSSMISASARQSCWAAAPTMSIHIWPGGSLTRD